MFLERVLSLIAQKGISKNKMLTDLKLNKNSFVDWGKHGNIPNGDVLSKISEYFNVSVDYLLGNETEGKSLDEQLKGIDFALHSESKELTDGEKQDVLNFVKFIKAKRENDK